MKDPGSGSQLVVFAASGEGLETIADILAQFPAEFPAPIVVAVHAGKRGVDRLLGMLDEVGSPAELVTSRERLQAGAVYVVPLERSPRISHQLVRLDRTGDDDPEPSFSAFLATAAQSFGENVIAVIAIDDPYEGAASIRAVRSGEGAVVVLNPETTGLPDVAHLVPPALVDSVADAGTIHQVLTDLLAAEPRFDSDSEREIQALLADLHERTGIDFSAYKPATIQRRIRHRMGSAGVPSVAAYRGLLERMPDEYQRLANSFLIKVTEFFRDPEFFEFLRTKLLPDLIDEARVRGGLRVWSAGCATGEEAYSLGMLLAELLPENDDLSVRIFATDVDADAIAYARRGVYQAQALEHVPAELVERYFTQDGENYEVSVAVRSMIVFGQHDLSHRAPFPRIDLVTCRNVLIYFSPELQQRALQLFAYSLRDGGYLALGKAETVTLAAEYFEPVDVRAHVYRRSGERIVLPLSRQQAPRPSQGSGRAGASSPGALRDSAAHPQHLPGGDGLADALMHLPVGILVIDREFQIQVINAAARRYLGIHGDAVGGDLLHLVQNAPLRPLRNAVSAAFEGETTSVPVRIDAARAAMAQVTDLEIICLAERGDRPAAEIQSMTIAILDTSRFLQELRERDTEIEEQRNLVAQQRANAEQASEDYAALVEVNESLVGLVNDLRAETDELKVANESAAGAIEEVQTLNEEMQATNDELETLNEEFQATNEELNATNQAWRVRTGELQKLTDSIEDQRRASEAHRVRLLAIFNDSPHPMIVVGSSGAITLTNLSYQELFAPDEPPTWFDGQSQEPLEGSADLIARASSGDAFSSLVVYAGTAEQGLMRFAARSTLLGDPGDDWRAVIRLIPLYD